MTQNMLPNPRKLSLNTAISPRKSHHRRSQHQLFAPAIHRHPGYHASDIIPCTCSESHMLTPSGIPCLTDILSPSPLILHSKTHGLVSPMVGRRSTNSYSTTLVSPKEDEQAETEALLFSEYELPFVQDDDFNYYPELSPRAHGPYSAVSTAAVESPVLGSKDKLIVEEEKVGKGEAWPGSWIEKVVRTLLGSLSLRK